MPYILRCILDVEEDVIRDIVLSEHHHLEDLHRAVVEFFNLPTGEMASFYRTNKDWDQGEEIPLINMNDAGEHNEMKDYKIADIFKNTADNLLYIYDFLNMWTFFITLQNKIETSKTDTPYLNFSVGQLPEKAPDKIFTGENMIDDFDTEFDTDFDLDEDIENYY